MCPKCLNNHGGKGNGSVATVQDNYESSNVPMVLSSDSRKEWIMDLSCTWHMTPNKYVFEDICDQDGRSVLLGNNRACKIVGIRYVRFKLHDESIRLLIDVKYIPNIKRNLISFGELDKKGYVFKGEQSFLRVMKGLKEVSRSRGKACIPLRIRL